MRGKANARSRQMQGVSIPGSIPGSIPLKKSRKVFDDVILLHNIWNALKLAFKHTVVVADGEIELDDDDMDVVDEEDEELFEQ